jgi:hypothetical protein
MTIHKIRTEAEYRATLKEISALVDADSEADNLPHFVENRCSSKPCQTMWSPPFSETTPVFSPQDTLSVATPDTSGILEETT